MQQLILYCDHWQNGGVESYLMNQLRHWDLTQTVCTILTAEKTTDIYDGELKSLGVRQEILLNGENVSPILRILHTFVRFEEFLKKNPCDVLYLNLTNSVTMRYAKIARKLGVPRCIVHSHCSGIQPGPTCPLKLLAHQVARRLYTGCATDWWACSDKAAAFLFMASVLPQVRYVPNAIQVERFAFNPQARSCVRKQLGIGAEERLIGTVGRCTMEKNQTFLLEAFALAHKLYPSMKLLLIGDGPLRVSLERKASELSIRDACLFYGFTDDVAPLYSAMDLFCLTSVLEGNPVSAIEAQANGCPCLLSDQITREADAGGKVCFLSIAVPDTWAGPLVEWHRCDLVKSKYYILPKYNVAIAASENQKELLSSKEK